MQKPQTIWMGLIVVVVVIGGIFFLNKKVEAPAPTTDTTATSNTPANTANPINPAGNNLNPVADKPSATVTLTDASFSPASLKVKKGQKVEFVNMSSGLMWVASAPHPSHTIYPAFDEKAVSQRGEIYAFTFDKVGTWKYHNHLNPSQTGTIIVE